MVMIDKGVPEICLFQSDKKQTYKNKQTNKTKNIYVQIQNEFHDFFHTKYKIMEFILHYLDRIWTEMFYVIRLK